MSYWLFSTNHKACEILWRDPAIKALEKKQFSHRHRIHYLNNDMYDTVSYRKETGMHQKHKTRLLDDWPVLEKSACNLLLEESST